MIIRKILIANRGEIARRIIRTCKIRGIKTVAVYSEADQSMPFVREADESVLIGPPPVTLSYLNIEKIIETAKKTGSQAIHPGYGLLSENHRFVRRCEEEGIVFLGPKSEVIQAMGDKIWARKIMDQANIPVVPGYSVNIDSVEQACEIASKIGYPVMMKASAGGGGIGMQLCTNREGVIQAFSMTKSKAKAYFGDDNVFIEKYIDRPRHIEVQIVGDHHGKVLHLFERECSIQRRHQKVVEESPSPVLSQEIKNELYQAAITAAKSIHYTGVGTVEFIVGEDHSFYFLEMNTRLQVEHPVTELITGYDLVGMQIDIAEGKPLSIGQEQISSKGHALEMRIYAEDPQTFLPSPGKITTYHMPEGENIRIEAGVEMGSHVTPFYDPMIAKVIVNGRTRDESITKALDALGNMKIEGIKTNISLLKKVLQHEKFRQGQFDTTFISKYVTSVDEGGS